MAGNDGNSAGLAVGAMTTVGYAGFVVGPPVMGWLADEVGLRSAMTALLVAALGMALAGMATRRPSAALAVSADEGAHD